MLESLENNEVDHQEGDDTADKTTHKGHLLSEVEARRGILHIIVERLEEAGRCKAEDDRENTVIEKKACL